jgi:hypothetical protein
MKKAKTFENFINESNQPINEGMFQYTPTAVKIAKDLMKKHETLQMSAENFDKIQAALRELDFQSYSVHGRIAAATKYTKYLQKEFEGKSSIFKGYRYLFDKSGKLKLIVDAVGGVGQDMGELIYIDGKAKDQDVETWAYENYPRLFKNVDWEVYQYADHNRGFGNAGTVEFVSAPTEKLARENTKANPSGKWDPFWIDHGIQQVSKQDIKQRKKEIKQMADHYAELVKQLGI